MTMRTTVLGVLLLLPSLSFAIDKNVFDNLISQINDKNYLAVEEFIETKREELKEDPEYYVILINYVISKGDQSQPVIGKGEPQPGDLELRHQKTGEVGFIGSRGGYDEGLIVDGIVKTQNAQKYFKTRLDIHFGIVTIAERIKRWDIVSDQIIEMLKTSKEIDNRWIWGPINTMSGEPKEFMIQNILPRMSNLFHAEDPSADAALQKISLAMIDLYPELIYGYANLGVLNLAKKDYEKARTYFQKALQIDPNDEIVLGNMEILRKRQEGQ